MAEKKPKQIELSYRGEVKDFNSSGNSSCGKQLIIMVILYAVFRDIMEILVTLSVTSIIIKGDLYYSHILLSSLF